MMTRNKPGEYQVFVLRLWQEMMSADEMSYGWRFSLEDPTTGQKRGFTCLEAFVAYLENLTNRQSGSTDEPTVQPDEN